ncbi:MAG TPA: hypothetical protein VKB73_07815 [Gaiellaceae bacterium]|nr:hypothetical protein [Gaiellaceae bacterium]
MAGERSKRLDEPDETVEFPGVVEHIVDIGDLTVARIVQQPGWRWSKDMRSVVEGEWCEAHHVRGHALRTPGVRAPGRDELRGRTGRGVRHPARA